MWENIKSKLILNKIFQNLKFKRKLNIIKHTNKLKQKLNLSKNDFDLYVKLKDFNEKYDTNIEDFNNNELNLRGKYIGDEGSIYLFDLGFKNLIKLDMKL